VSVPQDDEGSFAAGRQALLEALTSLEQRAQDRAERMVRDAERAARQMALESEQRAYQLTGEAEERARRTITEAELRARQVTLEAAQRLADLEQQLSEVGDNLESARAQIEEQVVAIRGQMELARASLNTVRQQLTSGGPRVPEAPTTRTTNAVPRVSIPPLSTPDPLAASPRDEVPAPTLNDLRAAVDALKKPRMPETVEPQAEPASRVSGASEANETHDPARRP
jgi:vacuolar-type H+-ATPase subunit H